MTRMTGPGMAWSAAFPPQSYYDADAGSPPDDNDVVHPKGTPQPAGENGVGNGKTDTTALIGTLTGDATRGKVTIRRARPGGGVGPLTGPK